MQNELNQYTMGVNKDYDAAVYKAIKNAPTNETGEPIPNMDTKEKK
jgi:hypothetical protein